MSKIKDAFANDRQADIDCYDGIDDDYFIQQQINK